MQNIFSFRDKIIGDYSVFSRSFSKISSADILEEVRKQYNAGRYWPEPLIQLNPNYQKKGYLHPLAEQLKTIAGEYRIFKSELPNDPLTVTTLVMEYEDGRLAPMISK